MYITIKSNQIKSNQIQSNSIKQQKNPHLYQITNQPTKKESKWERKKK